jgi:hypothetical protein
MMLPLGTFLAVYYLLLTQFLNGFVQDELVVNVMIGAIGFSSLATLTIVHWQVRKQARKISEEIGLGRKLDLYFPWAKKKSDSIIVVSLLPAVGLLLTGHSWFSIFFAIIFLWYLIQWPSPKKIANALKLKGDERKMVISKGEAFKM